MFVTVVVVSNSAISTVVGLLSSSKYVNVWFATSTVILVTVSCRSTKLLKSSTLGFKSSSIYVIVPATSSMLTLVNVSNPVRSITVTVPSSSVYSIV